MINSVNISGIRGFLKIKEGSEDYLYSHFSSTSLIALEIPFQVNAFIAGFCLKGVIELTIGINKYIINPFDFIIIPSNELIKISKVSDDFDFEQVIISTDFISKINISTKMFINFYISVEQNHIVSVNNRESRALILSLFDSINKLSKFYNAPSFKIIIQHYIYAFLYTISYIHEQFAPDTYITSNSKFKLLKHFFLLLQKHYKKQHSVNFYACELCVTSKYFSKCIKSLTGRTAGEWIRSIIILEAKIMLSKNDKFIQEIAIELNFSDQMAFSRFFKKYTGVSPQKYRLSESG